MDDQVLEALAWSLGHGPPFTDEELAACDKLDVIGARSLDDVEKLKGLKALDLIGCDVPSYEFLRHLPNLRVLHITNSNFADVSALTDSEFWVLHLVANRISDCEALGRIAGLQWVDLRGNPLAPQSRAVARSKFGRRTLVCKLDDDETWELCQQLHARGTDATYYQDRGGHYLSWTGLAHGSHPEAGHVPVSPATLRRELHRGTPLEEIMAAHPETDE